MTDEMSLRFEQVYKTYDQPGGPPRDVLEGINLEVPRGQSVAVIGRSGSGKSTLLHLAAGIDQPSRGAVELFGVPWNGLPDRLRARRRRDLVGLVFQFFYLQSHLTVWENVALPAFIAGLAPREFEPRLDELLARVDLSGRGAERVQNLSGGEQQRVAICRALLRRPALVLADEPTGNLDDDNGRQVMDLLFERVAAEGTTLLYVTHSRELAARADTVLHLKSGRLVEP